jgi:predicted ArsR family transcriptional regulator
LLRNRGSLSIAEAATATEVTATAVRQRLNRLMKQGLVERVKNTRGRGRPEHRYSPTEKAKRQAGNNYADLAQVLWQELRNVPDAEIRRGLLQRIADQMTRLYRDDLTGATAADRMASLKEVFADRRVPVEVTMAEATAEGSASALPVLTIVDCPYPELAARDRSVCAMEKQMFESLVDQPLRLSQCRLDGHSCCQFETK